MKQLLYIILILIGFSSCEDVIDVELRDNNLDLVVVEAQISSLDAPFCKIFKSEKVTSDEAFKGISCATVSIQNLDDSSEIIYLEESSSNDGFYSAPKLLAASLKTNTAYQITIEIDDYTITGIDTLREVEPIDSIQVRPSVFSTPLFLAVYTYGNEPAMPGQFYKWEVSINDTVLSSIDQIQYASDELVNNSYIDALEIFTDFHDPEQPEERILGYLDTISVRQSSISPFMYSYYSQLASQGAVGFLFSVPPANVKGNLSSSNGKSVLGYFSAHDVSVSNSVVIDDSIEGMIGMEAN